MKGNSILRDCLKGVHRRHFLLWVIISLVTTLVLTPSSLYPGSVALFRLASAIDYISWVYVNGIPIFLGAGVFLTTKETWKVQVDGSLEGVKSTSFMRQFILYEVLISLYMAAFSFSVLIVSALSFQGDSEFIYYAIPIVIVSTIIITTLIGAVSTLLAMIFDDWRLTTIAGLIPLFLISYNMGFPGNPATYREAALLSPVHFFKGLAFVLGGYENQRYFRIYFESGALLIPTVVLLSISFISLIGALRFYTININRWILEPRRFDGQDRESGRSIDVFSSVDDTQVNKLEMMRTELKKRRQISLAILISFLIIINIAIPNYTSARSIEDRKFVYQSPEDGESIEIGQWFNGSFIAEEPQDLGLFREFEFTVDILHWQTNMSRLKLVYGCESMSMTEFLQMNGTELESRYVRYDLVDSTDSGAGGGHSISDGPEFVWAMRFVDSEGNIVPGDLTIVLTMWTEVHRW